LEEINKTYLKNANVQRIILKHGKSNLKETHKYDKMKGEASCMTMVGILSTGARSKEEVTEQYAEMARWLLRLHGNCRNGILGAFSRWWRL
jgi:mRNA deadenylase 3'-5' endonuclease subunit Ccr4